MEQGNMARDLILGVIAIVVLVGGYIFLRGRVPITNTNENATSTVSTDTQGALAGGTMDTTGLKIETIKEGTGAVVKSGDKITVHYTGTLADGTVFDSSKTKNEPFTLTIGVGQVIPGWDLGLIGMKVGEVRKLTIPSNLAYGASGIPNSPIGPNATLTFEIELLSIN
jgi:FKBP-type peptidyl-prolyl cis-trans isomerase